MYSEGTHLKSKSPGTRKASKISASKSKKLNSIPSGETKINSLGSALGFNEGLQGVYPFGPGQEQLSQTNTLFKNLRWYLASNLRQLLSEMYVELGLVQTICDVPVDDGLRGGIEIKSKQLSEDQVQELQVKIDREDDLNTAGQAAKWNRLFGGAGILTITDQDPATPLDVSRITDKSPLELRAVDMWELFWDLQNVEGYQPIQEGYEFEEYSYYGMKIHKSRVMAMKGLIAPSFIRPRLRGWGFSVVEALVRSINQYLKATDLGFEVLDEFKLDIYKIKNLTDTLMSPIGEESVRRRVQMANYQKNYQNAITMDAEDDYLQKQLSFSGLAEAMDGIRKQVASDMRMPLTKLFGVSAAGFNSGQDDIEVYNSMIESQVRSKLKYHLLKILEIRCQQLFGFIPEDLSISFKPLRVMSAEQEENCKTQKFTRALQSVQAGQINTPQFLDICNRDNLLGIQLDTDVQNVEAGLSKDEEQESADNDPQDKAESDMESKDAKDADDGGANNPDKRRPQLPDGDSKDPQDIKE